MFCFLAPHVMRWSHSQNWFSDRIPQNSWHFQYVEACDTWHFSWKLVWSKCHKSFVDHRPSPLAASPLLLGRTFYDTKNYYNSPVTVKVTLLLHVIHSSHPRHLDDHLIWTYSVWCGLFRNTISFLATKRCGRLDNDLLSCLSLTAVSTKWQSEAWLEWICLKPNA